MQQEDSVGSKVCKCATLRSHTFAYPWPSSPDGIRKQHNLMSIKAIQGLIL